MSELPEKAWTDDDMKAAYLAVFHEGMYKISEFDIWLENYKDSKKYIDNDLLPKSIYDYDDSIDFFINSRTENALQRLKISAFGDLIRWRKKDLELVNGLGKKSIGELIIKLDKIGLKLKNDRDCIDEKVRATLCRVGHNPL